MEPGHEDREYAAPASRTITPCQPQWSPVMKTGNTETGQHAARNQGQPQWSPVMKTGNTPRSGSPSWTG